MIILERCSADTNLLIETMMKEVEKIGLRKTRLFIKTLETNLHFLTTSAFLKIGQIGIKFWVKNFDWVIDCWTVGVCFGENLV